MNIQHFSSLADILIDTEALTLDNPLSTAQYDEESFEQESHSNLPSSGVYHYDDDHERYDEEDVGREGDNNSQYYDNTFEETGGTYLSSDDHERVNERTALKVKEDHDDNEEEDNHYENTFENEYSKSYVGQNTPCPSIENILTTSTPSPKTLHSNVLFGGMSGIKATENIKTFEDLAIMSTPSNSNQSSPRGADSFDHEPTSTQPPPKMKIHVLPPSSEATRQKHTVSNIVPRSEIPEKIISSTPKLFSKVQFISKEEIEKESKKGQGERRRKMSGINNQQLKSSSKNIEPWNITSEDLDTMKKAKAVLDRIESQQKELQDQQAHRMAARKAVLVQNLDLGRQRPNLQSTISSPSTSPNDSLKLNEPNSVRSDEENLRPRRRHSPPLIGLDDDDGIYPTLDDDELSLESILSGRDEPRKSKVERSQSRDRMTSELGQKMQQKPRKSTNILKNNKFLDEKDLSNQQYLEDLAERSYFNFLSDIITVSRSRSLNASIEELAMQRILSERLYSYFSQPNQVKLLRHEMIRAAQDVQDIHPDNNSNSGR